jgi:hypothetical protein
VCENIPLAVYRKSKRITAVAPFPLSTTVLSVIISRRPWCKRRAQGSRFFCLRRTGNGVLADSRSPTQCSCCCFCRGRTYPFFAHDCHESWAVFFGGFSFLESSTSSRLRVRRLDNKSDLVIGSPLNLEWFMRRIGGGASSNRSSGKHGAM